MSDGQGCRCAARYEGECSCDVDWTPQELIDARCELTALRARVEELERELAATHSELQTLKEGACVDQKLGATLIRQRDAACADVSRLTAERDEARKVAAECYNAARWELSDQAVKQYELFIYTWSQALTRHAEKQGE